MSSVEDILTNNSHDDLLNMKFFDLIPFLWTEVLFKFAYFSDHYWRPSFYGILAFIIGVKVSRRPLQVIGLYKRWPQGWKNFIYYYNVLMCAYSFLTFIAISHAMFSRTHILDGKEWEDKWHNAIMEIFFWSKYVEFLDTFFLILLDKEVSWLHYLHHIGAPLAWGICSLHSVPGTWIGTWANSFVHTVMYMYYAFTNRRWKFPLPKFTVTFLQIFQLIGCVSSWSYLYGNDSRTSAAGGWFFCMYGLMCIGLFLNFFYVTYFAKKNGRNHQVGVKKTASGNHAMEKKIS